MQFQIFIGMIFVVILLIYQTKTVPWFIKIIWAYFALFALYTSYYPLFAASFKPDMHNLLCWNAARNLLQLLILPIAVFNLTGRQVKTFILFCWGFVIADSIYLMTDPVLGLLEAKTLDACVFAALLPMWFCRKKLWFKLPPIILSLTAIVMLQARTAALMVLVIALVYLNSYLKKRLSRTLHLSIIAGGLTLIWLTMLACFNSLVTLMSKIIADPRFEMWTEFINWWKNNANFYFGTSLGSFEWIGLTLYPGEKMHIFRFYLMHNDWLQILFESGIIGLTLSIIFYCYITFKIRKLEHVLAMWLSLGAMMFLYYPMHVFILQVVGLIILDITWRVDGPCAWKFQMPRVLEKLFSRTFSYLE